MQKNTIYLAVAVLAVFCQLVNAEWSSPEPHPELNDLVNGFGAQNPCISSDKMSVIFTRQISEGSIPLYAIFESKRGATSGSFTGTTKLSSLSIGGVETYITSLWLSEDGLRLYYCRSDRVNSDWKTIIKIAKRDGLESNWYYVRDIKGLLFPNESISNVRLTANELIIFWKDGGRFYTAQRNDMDSQFINKRELTELFEVGAGDICVSSDGLRIYISTFELEGLNKPNIYVGSRDDYNDPFSDFEHLENITDAENGGVSQYLSPDETVILFNSARIETTGHAGIFESRRPRQPATWHVDGTNGSDFNTGTGRGTAFATIQHAVYSAATGDTIMIWPGIYEESVFVNFKNIDIKSASDAAVLLSPESDAIIFNGNQGTGSVSHLVIAGSDRGIVSINNNLELSNLTITGNQIGLMIPLGSTVENCLFYDNSVMDNSTCIETANLHCQAGGIDPLFADPAGSDYHLKSEMGRFLPTGTTDMDSEYQGTWLFDDVTSPAVDAGDVNVNPQEEAMPNGGRINVGAFGNTAYASKSYWSLRCDLNKDGKCNFEDFVQFADGWMSDLPWKN